MFRFTQMFLRTDSGRKRRPAVLLAPLLLCGALLLAGCGTDSATSQPPLPKKAFLKKATAICYRLSKEQGRRTEAFVKARGWDWAEPGQQEREIVISRIVLPTVEEKIDLLSGLAPPKGDEKTVERIIGSMEAGVRATKAHPEWLAAPTAEHPETFTKTRELTAAYGIWLCGQA